MLSAVIITKNEDQNILRCIDSLKEIADEVLIIDSGSSDKTIELAEKAGANVIATEWLGYAKTKNFGNSNSTYDYILSIDADEVLSKDLRQSILLEKTKGFSGTYSFHRLTNYCGSWVRNSGWYPDEKIRIFDKTKVSWEGEFVHETLNIPNGTSNTKLFGDLLHYSYTSEEDHKSRADHYSELTALKLYNSGKTASLVSPTLSFLGRFIKMYFLKKGFLDGKTGYTIAKISAKSNYYKYTELNRLAKKEAISSKLKKILISRTDSIGDVILTLPMAKALKNEFSDVEISFLGRSYTQPIIECCQYVDEFVLYEDGKLPGIAHQYDAVFNVLPNKALSSHFKINKIPLRIGTIRRFYNLFSCNKFLFYSRKKSKKHESQLNLKMLKAVHAKYNYNLENISTFYGFEPKEKVPKHVENLLDEKPRIILHARSQGSAPEWDIENFNLLAKELVLKGFKVFFSGTEKEGALIRSEIQFNENIVDVTGQMTLHEFISFIGTCDGLIASSTGPLHIAAASEKFVIGLYSDQRPMFPKRWKPIGKRTYAIAETPENNTLTISVKSVMNLFDSKY